MAECIEFVRERLGDHWVLGAPLGLGKPNHLVNAFYQYAKNHPSLRLDIFTALSLNPPKPDRGLKQRFLQPFVARQFGDYPRLTYLEDLDRNAVPPNITVSEFYFRSGTRLRDSHAQRHYVSSNYTHVARDMQAKGVNILVQLVAISPDRPGYYSLGSNPDVTLELRRRIPREQLLLVAQVNEDLPYMEGEAELEADAFDLVLKDHPQRLFAVPRMPVSDADFLIGLHASQLIRDGGTLQLGIGSLGDAVSYFTVLRHQDNDSYRRLLASIDADRRTGSTLRDEWGGLGVFGHGLFAASEMFMDGFLHLYRAGILKRKVYDRLELQTLLNQGLLREPLNGDTLEVLWQHGALPPTLDRVTLDWLLRFGILRQTATCAGQTIMIQGQGLVDNNLADPQVRKILGAHALGRQLESGAVLHAAFFLGSHWMYNTLSSLNRSERALFQMRSVAQVNQLYGDEALRRAQRLEGRFINTTMKVSLLGAAASDQLENGQVVSGVGGQYNFVAMAHALERGRSVLMLRSHRGSGRRAVSNIVWDVPHTTIPRHLRDIVVTEYGVADLRSANDEQVVQKLICIADRRWQEQLRRAAVNAGKLDGAWVVPHPFENNSPEWAREILQPWRSAGVVRDYPFGSDFTEEEQRLARGLGFLAECGKTWPGRLKLLLSALGPSGKTDPAAAPALQRMGLEQAVSLRDRLDKRLVCLALKSTSPVSKDSHTPEQVKS